MITDIEGPAADQVIFHDGKFKYYQKMVEAKNKVDANAT